MPNSINLSLTDELRSYVDQNSGEGTLFATPSEFMRSLIREKKERQEAAELRASILEGFHDLKEGKVVEYQGSVKETLSKARNLEESGW